jgi:hypothetical protein
LQGCPTSHCLPYLLYAPAASAVLCAENMKISFPAAFLTNDTLSDKQHLDDANGGIVVVVVVVWLSSCFNATALVPQAVLHVQQSLNEQ